jgi:phospholipid-binding lipoprotein MlaA
MKSQWLVRVCALLFLVQCGWCVAQVGGVGAMEGDEAAMGEPPPPVRDPLRPFNVSMYHVNDKLYFWVLKPVARGYRAVLPEGVREGVRNMFHNLGAPKRIVNCLLQGKFKGSADECSRFLINSTVGVLGYRDAAFESFQIREWDEDLGQTLGTYGVGYGIYLNWPVLGPSNPRDTVGFVGDMFLDPLNYLLEDLALRLGVSAGRQVNNTSLRIGVYEENKELALDHYIWMRETYTQYRENLIKQ